MRGGYRVELGRKGGEEWRRKESGPRSLFRRANLWDLGLQPLDSLLGASGTRERGNVDSRRHGAGAEAVRNAVCQDDTNVDHRPLTTDRPVNPDLLPRMGTWHTFWNGDPRGLSKRRVVMMEMIPIVHV